MRVLTLTACVVLLAAADGSALAASGCGKGMLWPYVRQPGDCLTDDEIKAGQRGVYNGPVNTNPDMSGVRVETPAQSTGISESTGPRPSAPAGAPQTTVTSTGSSGPVPGAPVVVAPGATLFGGPATSDGPALNGPGFSLPPAQRVVRQPSCAKGWLWPFVRNPGDCLTEAEKGNGQTGVYRANEVVASAAPAASPGVTQVSTGGTAGSGSAGGGVEAPSGGGARAEPACRKGWLWPFVRKAGDCPTDVERGKR